MDYSRLKQLIDEIGVGMFTTVEADGTFHSRPMITAACLVNEQPAKSELWFLTAEGSPKAEEVLQDPRVCVAYSDPQRNRYVSVSGACELVHDSVRLEKFWRPEFRSWFPEGLGSDLALLRVSVDHVEFWERPSGRFNPVKRAMSVLSRREKASGPGIASNRGTERERHERADLRSPRVIATRKIS